MSVEDVSAIGAAANSASVEGAGGVRYSFVLHYLLAAQAAYLNLRRLEQEHFNDDLGSFFDDIALNALTGVVSVAAGLESYINEIFADRAIRFPNVPPGLMEELWKAYERNTVLQKYASAYQLATNTPLDLGKSPVQDVAALITLRNALVHFTPEWSYERDIHDRVSSVLRYKIQPNRWFKHQAGLFPMAWASADCAWWALTKAVYFIREFEAATGFPDKLGETGSRLLQAT
ncbi:MAG: hypothetical protein WDO56_14425 [Gammaproteobacteria bacterium]